MKTNGNAETAGIEKPRQHNFLRLWGGLVQRTFPFMEEEVGELGPKARLFVTVCETVVKPETFKYAKWKGVGRPPAKRMPVFNLYSLVECLTQRRREAESAEKSQKSEGKERYDKKRPGNFFHPIGENNYDTN